MKQHPALALILLSSVLAVQAAEDSSSAVVTLPRMVVEASRIETIGERVATGLGALRESASRPVAVATVVPASLPVTGDQDREEMIAAARFASLDEASGTSMVRVGAEGAGATPL